LRLRRANRIRRRPEFLKAYEQGTRIHGRYCTVFILPSGLPAGRLGIAATKKLGGAVQRNRAKRLIREIFRRNNTFAGYDIVVVPKRELLSASLSVLEADYNAVLARSLRHRR